MRFWIRRRSSGSVTSVQSSDFRFEPLEDFLSRLELEPPPPEAWRDDRDEDILDLALVLLVCSVSVLEPDSSVVVGLGSRVFLPAVFFPLLLSLCFCEEEEDFLL